jgi:hypothetical protein
MESNRDITMGDMAKHLLFELDKAGYLVVPKARCERAGMAT